MKTSFTKKTIIPTSADQIYKFWLDGEGHSKMTGGEAIVGDKVGESFTAWDGYISGKNIELEPGKRILQSWRTSNFKETDRDSQIEIILEKAEGGCQITLTHTEIPEGQPDYESGWDVHYFKPMKKYFSKA